MLHPGLKLQYFQKQKWEKDWIEEAERLTRDVYEDTYEKSTDVKNEEVVKVDPSGIAAFANISVSTSVVEKQNELDDYLRALVENTPDPLKWWHEHRLAYPNLSVMALDFLSAPRKCSLCNLAFFLFIGHIATSTAVERVFSQGRQVLHFTRNRSTPKAVRAFLCLGSWSRCGLITVEDIVKAVKGRSKKRKADNAEETADAAETVETVK